MSAYVEFYEGTTPVDPPPPGCYALCDECGWEGPHRWYYGAANMDAIHHQCPRRQTMVKQELERTQEELSKLRSSPEGAKAIRELALTATKLEEAEMWLDRAERRAGEPEPA